MELTMARLLLDISLLQSMGHILSKAQPMTHLQSTSQAVLAQRIQMLRL